VTLDGACVPPSLAAAYCGKAASYGEAACVPAECSWGGPADLATGACLSTSAVREIAAGAGLTVGAEDSVGCESGSLLSVEGGRLGCVPEEGSCGRGARWVEGGCSPPNTCPPGRLAGHAGCEGFLTAGGRDGQGVLVDVGAWTRLAIGPDGGEGAPGVCAPIAQRPWLFSGLEGAAPTELRLVFALVFPDNDVTRVHVQVTGAKPLGTDFLERTAAPLVEALRSLGGTATAASVTTTVRCPLGNASPPVARPLEGDGGVGDAAVETAVKRPKGAHRVITY
jgi:hypothetical protein